MFVHMYRQKAKELFFVVVCMKSIANCDSIA